MKCMTLRGSPGNEPSFGNGPSRIEQSCNHRHERTTLRDGVLFFTKTAIPEGLPTPTPGSSDRRGRGVISCEREAYETPEALSITL